jgi:alkane 1-monooxygenase
MAAAHPTSPITASFIPGRAAAHALSLHLLCLVLPLTTLGFLSTAPHRGWVALLWFLPLLASVLLDNLSPRELRQPAPALPAWPFDALLYLLVALQIVNLGLAVKMVAANGFFRTDTLVAVLLVGVNSGYSGIVVAHELIHRRERHMQLLGRILMGSVLYEHFYTEHLRGHHARVGTESDPATARFGETFHAFFRRTVPGQFRSAFRLEKKRLGDEEMGLFDRRLLRSRVVHGLVVEWGVAFAIAGFFGLGAFVLYVMQANVAVRLLEAVNYFEHWGLVRTGKRVSPVDSWDTDSWFTLYTLVGLSRHADHHAFAMRPFQELRHWQESPKLPTGYFGMVDMVLFRNRRFRELMTEELRKRKLGPFAPSEASAATAA